MNIRFSSLASSLFIAVFSLAAEAPLEYTAKQKTILLLNSLQLPVWYSTAPHYQPDPLFYLQSTTDALPGLPANATFFVSRTPRVVNFQELIDPLAFEDTALQPLVEWAQKIEVQEHCAGLQIGQLWNQENLEISWQGWVGARERNFWAVGESPNDAIKKLNAFTASPTRTALKDIYAPQEPQQRIILWHGTNTNIGIGDLHLQARYRIPLHRLFSVALGAYATIPVGTLANRVTPAATEEFLPLNNDHELTLRFINRLRDVMLTTPLGNGGHLGVGINTQAQLNLSSRWALRGQFSQIHYRSGLERRFALSPATELAALEEGTPGKGEGASSNELVSQHLKQKLYPTEIKTEIKPGKTQCLQASLNYAGAPLHGAIGYSRITTERDYSELAPLATLTRLNIENHQATASAGWRSRQQWGEASSYITGNYTVAGTHKGAWSVGIGATVQA